MILFFFLFKIELTNQEIILELFSYFKEDKILFLEQLLGDFRGFFGGAGFVLRQGLTILP